MHKKCQKCRIIRQYVYALFSAGVIAVVCVQAGFSQDTTLWSAFAGAVIPLMWFGYRQRSDNEEDRN